MIILHAGLRLITGRKDGRLVIQMTMSLLETSEGNVFVLLVKTSMKYFLSKNLTVAVLFYGLETYCVLEDRYEIMRSLSLRCLSFSSRSTWPHHKRANPDVPGLCAPICVCP